MKSFECFYEFSVCHYHSRGFLFDQAWIALIQECFVPTLVEIGPVVLEIFLLSWYYLPFDKGVVLLLNKLESSWRRGALRQVWLKLVQWISLFYRGVALHLDKLEFQQIFISTSWNLLCGSWKHNDDDKWQQRNESQKN